MEEKRMDGKEIAKILRQCASLRCGCPASCPCYETRGRTDCIGRLMVIAAEHLEQEERDNGTIPKEKN